jgi:hypothetical protein
MRLLGVVALCMGLITPAAAATDYPYRGVTSGPEKDFMQYSCERPTADGMLCKFTQLTIRKLANPDDLEKRLSRISEYEKEIRDDPQKHAEGCKEVIEMVEALKSGRAPDKKAQATFDKHWSAASPEERQDLLHVSALLQKVCDTPTRENFGEMIRAEHKKDMRTCMVNANNFEQTFQRGANGMWVHNGAPEGECGVISVSSFERDDPKFSLWNYKTRKIVTNKKGGSDLLSCTIFDETEFTYTWKTETFFKGCDYVKHGF